MEERRLTLIYDDNGLKMEYTDNVDTITKMGMLRIAVALVECDVAEASINHKRNKKKGNNMKRFIKIFIHKGSLRLSLIIFICVLVGSSILQFFTYQNYKWEFIWSIVAAFVWHLQMSIGLFWMQRKETEAEMEARKRNMSLDEYCKGLKITLDKDAK